MLVKSGTVMVNGKTVTMPWQPVFLGDKIAVSGGAPFAVAPPPPPVLWAVHKLPGEVSLSDDMRGRPSLLKRLEKMGAATKCKPVVRCGGRRQALHSR